MPKTKYPQFDSPSTFLKGTVYVSTNWFGKQKKYSTANKSKTSTGNEYSGIGGLGGGTVANMYSGPFPIKF